MNKQHLPCSDCGSSDALTEYDNNYYCFACGKSTKKNKEEELTTTISTDIFPQPSKISPNIAIELKVQGAMSKSLTLIDRIKSKPIRGISKEAAAFYGIWINDKNEHVYPYFDRHGKHVANQYRIPETKGFMVQGDYNKTGLFGQQLFPAGSAKQITVVEGAIDAPSAFQMTGNKWPVVAVKSVSSAPKEIADNFEYLNSFDKVVICFDNDKEHHKDDGTIWFPGQEAAQKVASMFPLGKVRILTLKDAKDANDYLQKGWSSKFIDEWWKAPEWTPVGLRYAKDMWEEVVKEEAYETVPYPWDGLNAKTYGIRTSEFVTITAMPGVGKTSILRETVFNILNKIMETKDDSRGIGLMFLEDSNRETLLGLMSLAANKPLHLPDVRAKVKEDELKKYFDTVYKDEKVILWDHFGSNEIDKVLSFVRYMHNLGCKYIILDHLSIIVSDQSGDERKQLDEISTKLKTLCMELNIALICVIHQNRKGEIRGTMGVEQLSNIVIKLYRDVKNSDDNIRNTLYLVVEKNRFCGRTGPACALKYDGETGRLTELPTTEGYEEEKFNEKEEKEEW